MEVSAKMMPDLIIPTVAQKSGDHRSITDLQIENLKVEADCCLLEAQKAEFRKLKPNSRRRIIRRWTDRAARALADIRTLKGVPCD